MGTLMLTLLLGASILLIAKIFPGSSGNDSSKASREQNPTSGTKSTAASGKRPALTVVIVLATVWALLSLATAYPVVLVVALLGLAVGACLVYRVWHPGSNFRILSRKLFSDLRPLAMRVRDDFWTSFVLLQAWQRERAARIRQERAAEQERQAQERARLERIERERRSRRYNDHLTVGEYEDIQRRLQREQQRHAERMEQDRRNHEYWRDWQKRQR